MISVDNIGHALIVKLEVPDLHVLNVREFRAEMETIISDGVKHLVVDLSNVKFLDSCGLGSLINVYRKCLVNSTSLCFINVSKAVIAVFELTKLHKIFDIYKTSADLMLSIPNIDN